MMPPIERFTEQPPESLGGVVSGLALALLTASALGVWALHGDAGDAGPVSLSVATAEARRARHVDPTVAPPVAGPAAQPRSARRVLYILDRADQAESLPLPRDAGTDWDVVVVDSLTSEITLGVQVADIAHRDLPGAPAIEIVDLRRTRP